MIWVILVLSIISRFCITQDFFTYKLYPECTVENPLVLSKEYEIVPTDKSKDLPIDTIFIVEQLQTPELNGTVLGTQNITILAPYVRMYEPSWNRFNGKNYTTPGTGIQPEYIKITAYDPNSNTVIQTPENVQTIYWDFRYTNLKFTYKFENIGPCEVLVTPIASDGDLEKHTKLHQYLINLYPGGKTYRYETQGNKTFRWVSNTKFVRYLQHFSKTGYAHRPFVGLSTHWSDESKFALVCCSQVTDCPTVAADFPGHVHFADPMEHKWQMPLWEKKISVIENVTLFIPLHLHTPQFIDVYLPFNFTVDPYYSAPFYYHEMLNSSNSTMNIYRFARYSGSSIWVYANRAFIFPIKFNNGEDDSIYGKHFDMYLQVEDGPLQKLIIIPQKLKKLKNFPKRFITSLTWGEMDWHRSYESYKNMGFTYIGNTGLLMRYGTSAWEKYKHENRGNWTQFGLQWCPEASLFHNGNSYGTVEGYDKITPLYRALEIELDGIDESWIPVDVPNRASEIQLWRDSLLYYNSTKEPDLAYVGYDGYFYKSNLKLLEAMVNYYKPPYLNFDMEGWAWSGTYYQLTADKSPNFLKYKSTPEETHVETKDRLINKMLSDIKAAVLRGHNETKTIFYYVQAQKGFLFQSASWDQWEKYLGTIPQPQMYVVIKSAFVSGNMIRVNKQHLKREVRHLVPMPAQGTYGLFNSTLTTFNWCIQTFGNGATGLMWYGVAQIYNHDFFVEFQECLSIFAEFEDIVMDGELAFHDIRSNVSNYFAIGAMKDTEMRLLLALSTDMNLPLDEKREMKRWGEVNIKYPHSKYKLRDLRTNKKKKSWYNETAKEIVMNVDFLEEAPTVFLVESYYGQYVTSLVVGIVIGSIFTVVLIVAVIATFVFGGIVLSILGKREKKEGKL